MSTWNLFSSGNHTFLAIPFCNSVTIIYFLFPYSWRCQWCPKTYEQLEGLRRHIRQHVGDEKFVCQDCGKKFITSIQLKRHLWLSHDQDSPYRRSILWRKKDMKLVCTKHCQWRDRITIYSSSSIQIESGLWYKYVTPK